MQHKHEEGGITTTTYALHEYYYNLDSGSIQSNSWTKNPITLDQFESVDDLIESLDMMLKDAIFYRDQILDYETGENL